MNPVPAPASLSVERSIAYGQTEVIIHAATRELALERALAWSNDWRGYEPRTFDPQQMPDGSWRLRGQRWSSL